MKLTRRNHEVVAHLLRLSERVDALELTGGTELFQLRQRVEELERKE